MSSFEIMRTYPGSSPRLLCIVWISTRTPNQSNNRNDGSILRSWKQSNQRFIDSGFIREEQHPDWVANTVPLPKKNEKIWTCIDYRDLNVACPKDKFSLPITDVMIENMCDFERMPFMDGFSGYNQIKMYHEDENTYLSGHLWEYTATQ